VLVTQFGTRNRNAAIGRRGSLEWAAPVLWCEKPDRPQLLLGAETVIIFRRVLLLAAYL